MTTPDDQNEWVTIDQAVLISGRSRATLWRWVEKERISHRVEMLPTPQTQRRVLFRRSELTPPDRDAV